MTKSRAGELQAVLLALLSAGCQDAVRPASSEGGLAQVTIVYLCGNRFELYNQSSTETLVHYAVLGTADSGDVMLPAGSSTAPSATRLITLDRGPLQVWTGEEQGERVGNASAACPPPATEQPQAATGEWSAPFAWPVVAVHLHLLPNGHVLSWGHIGSPQVYDPASGTFTEAPVSTMVFCSGHTFLPDGRLLVSGGHLDDQRGLRDVNVFDPGSENWSAVPSMVFARWYPTNTTLGDGSVITLAGTDEAGQEVDVPEVWTGASWRALPGARQVLPYYPRTFVAPNGLLFYAGELKQTAYLDPAGGGHWIPVANSNYGRRDYGSAVMYQPGKVMIVGGSDPPDGPPTKTAELIDLNRPAPAWRYTEPMTHARRHLNATILPDGQVLVTGGTSAPGFSDPSGAVHAAEVWDPATERWGILAANQKNRVYHSSTLLLTDGRVLHAGSGDGPGLPRELNAEIFSPPYLFRGPRPRLEAIPQQIAYGQPFFVSTSDAAEVVRVTLIRLASVTHAFDQSQRFVEVSFRRAARGLRVTSPSSSSVAPPGPYLLTILNDAGVPSISHVVRIHQ